MQRFLIILIILSICFFGCEKKLNTELSDAVYISDFEELKSLLESGADINAMDKYGLTPWIVAINIGDMELLEFLMSNGADVNVKVMQVKQF